MWATEAQNSPAPQPPNQSPPLTNVEQMAALAEGGSNPNGAETISRTERVKKHIMTVFVECAWWKNVSLAQRAAEGIEEREEQIKHKTSLSRRLAKKFAVCNAKLAAANKDIAAKDAAIAAQRSDIAAKDAVIAAQRSDIVAKEAVIAAQRSEITEAKRTVFDKSNTIMTLTRKVEELESLHEVSDRTSTESRLQKARPCVQPGREKEGT